MSFSSTTDRATYAGTGTTDTYAFSFLIYDESELRVWKYVVSTGAITEMSLSTDYTVDADAVSNPSGGNIVLVAGNLPSGTTLIIERDPPQDQDLDLSETGGFDPQAIEAALDKAKMAALQAYNEALVLGPYTTGTLPDAARYPRRLAYVKDPASAGVLKFSNQDSSDNWNWDDVTLV